MCQREAYTYTERYPQQTSIIPSLNLERSVLIKERYTLDMAEEGILPLHKHYTYRDWTQILFPVNLLKQPQIVLYYILRSAPFMTLQWIYLVASLTTEWLSVPPFPFSQSLTPLSHSNLSASTSVISIGHCHPHYVEKVTEQLNKLGFYSNSVIFISHSSFQHRSTGVIPFTYGSPAAWRLSYFSTVIRAKWVSQGWLKRPTLSI